MIRMANETENVEVNTNSTEQSNIQTESSAPKSRREVIAQMRDNETARAKRNEQREVTRMNWEQLKSARHENRILTSTVISVEAFNDGKMIGCVVMFGGFRIIIPCEEMYVNSPLDTATIAGESDRIRREKQMLSKLLGTTVPFIITNIVGNPESSEYAVIASRKAAITRTAARNFNKHGRNGKANIEAEQIVDADIISVGKHAVWANVCGLDVSIPTYLLTHRYVGLVSDVYKPGDKLKVYIRNIDYDESGHALGIEVSGREPEIEEFIPRLKHVSSGAMYLGRITSIRRSASDDSRTIITLFLSGIELPAIANYTRIDSMREPPCTGDTVVFSAYSVNEDRGLVIGSILRRC